MFGKLRLPWRLKDRGGYTIKWRDRGTYEYRDELGSSFICVEMGFAPDVDYIVYCKLVYTDLSAQTLEPDPARRALVAERVCRALEADGCQLDVVE